MKEARVLVSVADKTGVVEFCRALEDQVAEFIASGGTAAVLRQAGLRVTPIEKLGAFPEMLDGRVKTLQPQIHGGILARRDEAHLAELRRLDIQPIDMVVVNLYPFEATVARTDVTWAEAMEQIDIGGVALMRAAAKNHASVTVVVDPADYPTVAAAWSRNRLDAAHRSQLALKAFRRTMAYDLAIAQYMESHAASGDGLPDHFSLALAKLEECRYGENPHQRGGFYGRQSDGLPFQQLQGKAMSFNNWLDLDGSWRSAHAFDEPTVSIVKHGNPCGIASGPDLARAYEQALASDPVSAFGGIIACNRVMDEAMAAQVVQTFVEVVAAPGFAEPALARLKRRKNVRVLMAADVPDSPYRMQSVWGGVLIQDQDRSRSDLDSAQWECATRKKPTSSQLASLRFAWNAARFIKSNAIVLVRDTATVGIGAGQMSRLDSVHLAVRKAGERVQGAVLASDAFFPFPDGIEEAARAGVVAVVQPGGSMRDRSVIQAADDLDLVMMFTGTRHFRH